MGFRLSEPDYYVILGRLTLWLISISLCSASSVKIIFFQIQNYHSSLNSYGIKVWLFTHISVFLLEKDSEKKIRYYRQSWVAIFWSDPPLIGQNNQKLLVQSLVNIYIGGKRHFTWTNWLFGCTWLIQR